MKLQLLFFRKFAGIAALAIMILAIAGCATKHGVATINSVPPGVQVFDMEDGSAIGSTPVSYHWRSKDVKRKYMNLRLHKEGYEDVVKSFWLNLQYRSAESAHNNPQHLNFELSKSKE